MIFDNHCETLTTFNGKFQSYMDMDYSSKHKMVFINAYNEHNYASLFVYTL